MASWTRLGAVARKEVLQLRRDPRSLLLAFLLPVLLLVLFGYAITWDVENVKLAVMDQDRSSRSRELVEALTSSGRFRLVAQLERPSEIRRVLERRRALAVLVVPPDFAAGLDAGRTVPVQALVDGSDANTATIAIGYLQAVIQSYTLRARLHGEKMRLPIVTQSRVWYNEELKSRDTIVPGLIAVIMMIIAAILTSLTIAREWERGTMEQLASTPVTRVEVVVGKLLPYLAIGIIDVIVSTVLGVVLFGVPLRGSLLLFAPLATAFLVGSLGLGMLISATAKSQLLATQVAMVATFLPAFLISGFMFAIEVMPPPLQAISLLVPARYFLVVTRGIFLKGVGPDVLWPQGLLMIVYAVLGLGLAVRAFRKELA